MKVKIENISKRMTDGKPEGSKRSMAMDKAKGGKSVSRKTKKS